MATKRAVARWVQATQVGVGLVSLLAVLGAFACDAGSSGGDGLSRSRAQDMIVDHAGYPMEHTGVIVVGSVPLELFDIMNRRRIYEAMAGDGLITYASAGMWGFSGVTLTPRGRQYVVGEVRPDRSVEGFREVMDVRLSTLRFVEVTGIVRQDEEAIVEYAWRHTDLTPFASHFGLNDEVKTGAAHFTLYDDGWRLTRLATR